MHSCRTQNAINQNENEMDYNAQWINGSDKTNSTSFMVKGLTFSYWYYIFAKLQEQALPLFVLFHPLYNLSVSVQLPKPKLFDHKLLKCNDLSPPLSLSGRSSSKSRLKSLPHYSTSLSIPLAYIWDLRHFLIFSSRTHLSWPGDEL